MTQPKITVVGSGYVGMSLGVLLAQQYSVTLLDIDPTRVALVNAGESTVVDAEITTFLKTKALDLKATLLAEPAYETADIVMIATPTNYDPETNSFDTRSVDGVDGVVEAVVACNQNSMIVIKSTAPVGHTERLSARFAKNVIFFRLNC